MKKANPKQARKRAAKIAKRKTEEQAREATKAEKLCGPVDVEPAPDAKGAPLLLWLDDERPTPPGWTGCRWPQEVIAHLEQAARKGRPVTMSLDHDLGEWGPDARTGYDVLTWLEERAFTDPTFPLPVRLKIHTANPAAREKMRAARASIYNRRRQQEGRP